MPLDSFVYSQRDIGKDELYNTFLTNEWYNNTVRMSLCDRIWGMLYGWHDIARNIHLTAVVNILALAGILMLMLREMINCIRRVSYDRYSLFVSMIIIVEFFAIVAFLPEGRPYYLFPILYSCYLIIFLKVVHQGE